MNNGHMVEIIENNIISLSPLELVGWAERIGQRWAGTAVFRLKICWRQLARPRQPPWAWEPLVRHCPVRSSLRWFCCMWCPALDAGALLTETLRSGPPWR